MRKFIVRWSHATGRFADRRLVTQEPTLVHAPTSPVTVGQDQGRCSLRISSGWASGFDHAAFAQFADRPVGRRRQKGSFPAKSTATITLELPAWSNAIGDETMMEYSIWALQAEMRRQSTFAYFWDGSGRFMPVAGSPFTASAPMKTYKPSIRLVDINKDKNLDVVAANGRRNTIEILFGDGRGRFSLSSIVKLEPGFNNPFVCVSRTSTAMKNWIYDRELRHGRWSRVVLGDIER